MEYTKEKELSGILVAIDFEKAFDTLDLNFLGSVSIIQQVLRPCIDNTLMHKMWFIIIV